MKTLRTAVYGAAGKMGQETIKKIKATEGFILSATLDHKIRDNHFETYEQIQRLKKDLIDVVIDFSSPQGLLQALQWCVKNGVPLVTGTTGFSKSQIAALNKAAKKIPVLHSANMSPGINSLLQVLKTFSKNFKGEVEIEEWHHRQKKDNPSGTALLIKKTIEESNSKIKIPTPHGIRGGKIVGVHKIYFISDDEIVTFEHQANARAVFAQGALDAARWLVKQKPGLYEFKHIFGDIK